MEPNTVLAEIEATERRWSAESRQAGEEYLVDLLNECRASWAIFRQWTGHDPAVAERAAHIQRLERLVWDAIYALQKAGLDKEAGAHLSSQRPSEAGQASLMRIAILGWGSLIWDPRDLPLAIGWAADGPVLPIEFSRVSGDRRLTLVVDPVNGSPVMTRFAISRRETLQQAIRDLQAREKMGENSIGFVDLRNERHHCRHDAVLGAIREWVARSGVDAAIWTDLSSNFLEATGHQFSVDNALSYLAGLSGSAAEQARRYIERAPLEVDTEVRRAIDTCSACRSDPCFVVARLPPRSRPWNPGRAGRPVLISEAPPESNGFWHLPDRASAELDDLRAQVLQLLASHGLILEVGPHNAGALRAFMTTGFFLVQALKWPLAKREGKKGRSFNHLPRSDQVRLIQHSATAHLRGELSAIAPWAILTIGSAALWACRALSERRASIPAGGIEGARKSNGQGSRVIPGGLRSCRLTRTCESQRAGTSSSRTSPHSWVVATGGLGIPGR